LECGFDEVSVRAWMKLLFEDCVLDLDTREVLRRARPVALSPKAFALLELLALRRPKALSKAEIHAALWPDTFVSETNLANLVVELRAALGDDVHASRVVRTVPRFGYAFCAEARSEDSSLAAARGVTSEHRLFFRRREIALLPGENVIGRERMAVVWINDESVSRRHARVVVGEDGAWLEDLGSKNGTFLRGRAVTRPTRLEDGEEFTLGEVAAPLRYHCSETTGTTRTGRAKGRRDSK
jgi:DNA-binding winged helix-turn-helix (wHTH) protein